MKIFLLNELFLTKYNKCRNILYINFILAIIMGLIPIMLIKVKQIIIDESISNINSFLAFSYLIGLILLYLINHSAEMILKKYNDDLKRFLTYTLKKTIIEKVSKIPFHLTEDSEILDLIKLVENTPEWFLKIFNDFKLAIIYIIQILGTIIIILFIDYKILIPIIILTSVGIILNIYNAKNNIGFWQKYIQKMRFPKYISSIMISKEYVCERKLFNYIPFMNEKFEKEFDNAKDNNKEYGFNRFKIQMLLSMVSDIYVILSFLILLPYLLNGNLSIGMYTSLSIAITNLLNCIENMIDIIYNYSEHKKNVEKWLDFLRLPELNYIAENSLPPTHFEKIEFQNVYFTYPKTNNLVLKGVSFTLKRGMHYSIVGENGSGKSTITKLLLGLYTPDKGKILIDDKDITKISQNELRGYFSAIFQDFAKYPFTVKENICLGNMECINDDSEMLKIIKDVELHEKINSLPQKLDTNLINIQEDGVDFSGGQWQKLAISRMLLSKKNILILDEPNAALDPLSEVRLYDFYRKILKSKTAIFISHRLGSIKLCDKILVLKDGRIIENGSHNELMKNEKYYYKLFTKQRSFYDQ